MLPHKASMSINGLSIVRQQGVALVTILVIVALASLLAAALTSNHRLNITQASALLEQQRAHSYALSGEAYARALLRNETEQQEEGLQHRNWRRWQNKPEVEEGEIFVRIEDLQGLFNLNALADENYLKIFNRLLEQLQIDPKLAPLATDWLDTDTRTSLYGAEDGDYLLQKPPFRAANAMFHSVLELGMLGRVPIKQQQLADLFPLLTVLPVGGGQKFNINNLHPLVLKALAPDKVTEFVIQTISSKERPFRNSEELAQAVPELEEVMEYLEFSSRFFRADVYAHYRDRRVGTSTVIYRQPDSGETAIISRRLRLPKWLKLPHEQDQG